MNIAEGKPGHGLTSAERTREERRIGSGQRSRERTPFLSQEGVISQGFGESTCRENAQSLDLGGPGLQGRVILATLW